MRNKIIIGIVSIIAIIFLFKYCEFKKNDDFSLENNTNLIQQKIVNVGKLVVTEGHFAEVLTYKDQDTYFGRLIALDKRVLIILNAKRIDQKKLVTHPVRWKSNIKKKNLILKKNSRYKNTQLFVFTSYKFQFNFAS